MKDIKGLICQLIPTDDYRHRNGFSNKQMVDDLSDEEKFLVETELINLLKEKTDMLIVETLGYMKSERSLSVLYELIEKLSDKMAIIITAVSIFEITQDQEMIVIAKTLFKDIKDKYQLIIVFHYLARFQEPGISKLINDYVTDPDYLISYNAKQALGI